jgi:hypothetical protein
MKRRYVKYGIIAIRSQPQLGENRRITETTPDRFPNAARLDPLRSAPAKLDPVEAAALRRPPAAKNAKPDPNLERTSSTQETGPAA